MITDTINSQIHKALKKKDEIRVSTLKLLLSALHNAKIEKMDKLNKEEEIEVVKKEAKRRKDAIEAYEKVEREDRVKKEKKELEILEEFLPEQMSDEELDKLVVEAIKKVKASSMADMGKIMGAVMPKVKGMADGGRVSGMVKKKLSG